MAAKSAAYCVRLTGLPSQGSHPWGAWAPAKAMTMPAGMGPEGAVEDGVAPSSSACALEDAPPPQATSTEWIRAAPASEARMNCVRVLASMIARIPPEQVGRKSPSRKGDA